MATVKRRGHGEPDSVQPQSSFGSNTTARSRRSGATLAGLLVHGHHVDVGDGDTTIGSVSTARTPPPRQPPRRPDDRGGPANGEL